MDNETHVLSEDHVDDALVAIGHPEDYAETLQLTE
jgi:hypothetical protein